MNWPHVRNIQCEHKVLDATELWLKVNFRLCVFYKSFTMVNFMLCIFYNL